jgi:AAA domain/Helicase
MTDKQPIRTEFLTGAAGTGKTFTIKQRIEDDPAYGILCATTGVAAVNMDTVTINSLLRYFDTQDLLDKYARGLIQARLRAIAPVEVPRELIVDEASMMPAEQLDTLYTAIYEVNTGDNHHEPRSLGLILTGDFCQLPPVKARWAFQADNWPEFAKNITRLTKFWRQTDPKFLESINAARRGDGGAAASGLKTQGTQFCHSLDMNYDGTTVFAKNDAADRFNQQRLLRISEHSFALESQRWGFQSPDWKHIPAQVIFKPTCLVMILANKKYDQGELLARDRSSAYRYVNGDLAHVITYDDSVEFHGWKKYLETGEEKWRKEIYNAPGVQVGSLRTGETFWVPQVVRQRTMKAEHSPEGLEKVMQEIIALHELPIPGDDGSYSPFYDEENKRWVIGSIEYFPLRLGYASTVHKTQGLSLDRVQIDCRDGFFGKPSMAYVALSRARSVEGIRIVGTPDLLARRIKFNPEVREWL